MADQTVLNQIGFAPQIAPYGEGVLAGAAAQVGTGNPYQSYADWAASYGLSGDQVAAFQDLQNKAFTGANNLATNQYSTDSAAGLAALARQAGNTTYSPTAFAAQQVSAPSLQNYQMTQPANVQGQTAAAAQLGNAPTAQAAQGTYNPGLLNYQMQAPTNVQGQNVTAQNINAAQMGAADRVNTSSFTGAGTADQFMNPYMQSVVDIQKREARRQAGIEGTQQAAQAASAGALGGGRDAIMRAERERNLAEKMGDIQAQGSAAAYEQAQKQFNAEQAAGLTAQQANQQAGLTVGTQNLTAQQQANVQNAANALQASGMSATNAQQAALANQQAGLTAGQQNLAANLATQQLGANIGAQQNLANVSNQQQANLANQQQAGAYGLQQGQLTQAANLQNAQLAQQAGLANQQAGLTTGQQNLAANLQTQQLGSGQNMQAQLANQSQGLAAQQAGEQSRQFGANLGLQGTQMGLQGYTSLGSQGQNLYGQTTDILGIQNRMGTQQQQQVQAGLDVGQQNYAAEMNDPYKRIGFMSDIVRGAPMSGLGSTVYQAPPSLLSQGLGAASAFYGATKKAAGGRVRAGLVDLALSRM